MNEGQLIEILLGLVATMVATLVWVVRADSVVRRKLITTLVNAVDGFREFERSEASMHGQLIETQRQIINTQANILRIIERMDQKIGESDWKAPSERLPKSQ